MEKTDLSLCDLKAPTVSVFILSFEQAIQHELTEMSCFVIKYAL